MRTRPSQHPDGRRLNGRPSKAVPSLLIHINNEGINAIQFLVICNSIDNEYNSIVQRLD